MSPRRSTCSRLSALVAIADAPIETEHDAMRTDERPSQQNASDRWIDARALGQLLGVSRTTLWRWRRERQGFPQPVRLGPNSVRYSMRLVESWIAQHIEAVREEARDGQQ